MASSPVDEITPMFIFGRSTPFSPTFTDDSDVSQNDPNIEHSDIFVESVAANQQKVEGAAGASVHGNRSQFHSQNQQFQSEGHVEDLQAMNSPVSKPTGHEGHHGHKTTPGPKTHDTQPAVTRRSARGEARNLLHILVVREAGPLIQAKVRELVLRYCSSLRSAPVHDATFPLSDEELRSQIPCPGPPFNGADNGLTANAIRAVADLLEKHCCSAINSFQGNRNARQSLAVDIQKAAEDIVHLSLVRAQSGLVDRLLWNNTAGYGPMSISDWVEEVEKDTGSRGEDASVQGATIASPGTHRARRNYLHVEDPTLVSATALVAGTGATPLPRSFFG
ncbi:hypothetical protein F5Y17DRAFT_428691 [Xylariaceae sp. FL0594]|nr:hypothetical protein F5Y17DRAFT_428691 [Xylariaceae sp. FL0594]